MTSPIEPKQTGQGYAETAKKLGCTFRIGKYGVKLLPHSLTGLRKPISITPLDGWLFDDDMLHVMKERNYEL